MKNGHITFKAIHVSLWKKEEGDEGIPYMTLLLTRVTNRLCKAMSSKLGAYLLVLFITALNNSSCQLLLFSEWTPLQEGGSKGRGKERKRGQERGQVSIRSGPASA